MDKLEVGTKLEVNSDLPINQGRSGLPGNYTITDIVRNELSEIYYYQISFHATDSNSNFTDTQWYSLEKLMTWLKPL